MAKGVQGRGEFEDRRRADEAGTREETREEEKGRSSHHGIPRTRDQVGHRKPRQGDGQGHFGHRSVGGGNHGSEATGLHLQLRRGHHQNQWNQVQVDHRGQMHQGQRHLSHHHQRMRDRQQQEDRRPERRGLSRLHHRQDRRRVGVPEQGIRRRHVLHDQHEHRDERLDPGRRRLQGDTHPGAVLPQYHGRGRSFLGGFRIVPVDARRGVAWRGRIEHTNRDLATESRASDATVKTICGLGCCENSRKTHDGKERVRWDLL
mmetsp:Transcript_2428/g.6536  ORF Transcript_2428/g.6536 Transcript_2428/m.6536 type:complete len:261 (+) Transcript_2428:982-1764(+)